MSGDEPGDVPGYVLREVVGRGALATVWRGEVDGAPGRIVAIKRVHGAVDETTLEDLHREAAALERLSHPSILRLLDVVTTPQGPALVVAYAPGGSLADRLAGPGPGLAPPEVADLGARLAGALAAAHTAGLVHRDVKPANVLFDAEGQPLLADFGTARLLGDAAADAAGTVGYLAPEALREAPGNAHDVYGLGATLYAACTGRPPRHHHPPPAAGTAARADRDGPPPLAEDVPASLRGVIEQALASEPDARPTAADLAGRLDEVRRGLEADAGSAAGVPPTPTARRSPATRPTAGHASTGGPEPGTLGASVGGDAPPARTRRFGPPPPSVAAGAPRSRRRGALLGLAAAALAVPVGLVWWLAGDTRTATDAAQVADEADAATGDAAQGEGPGGRGTVDEDHETDGTRGQGDERSPRRHPSRCEDAPSPPAATGAEILEADVAGQGCTVPVAWDGERLLVPGAAGDEQRYDLDAEAGDRLLLGDWTCDAHDTPALYRPTTGELFLFDGFARQGEEVTGRVEDTGVAGGEPAVTTDADGCDHVEVAPG